ncbi:hypothetical protein K457DRAFT_844420 [Linnemannia elongata AG-77]|uniref:Uncharacterized protein n=1 Tax=Linnemannia elongata AG-77 TaxID=1314771 RepID=A0A197JID7_9FUNG|nr:hypothetical protein K457DRAFT_844420 [Linnemannia elongata AG-77]
MIKRHDTQCTFLRGGFYSLASLVHDGSITTFCLFFLFCELANKQRGGDFFLLLPEVSFTSPLSKCIQVTNNGGVRSDFLVITGVKSGSNTVDAPE